VALRRRWCLRLARARLWLEPPPARSGYSLSLDPDSPPSLPLPGWVIKVRDNPSGSPSLWQWRPPRHAKLTVQSPLCEDVAPVLPTGRKLSRLLCNHLPRHLRAIWPLFCISDTIFWIPGVWQHTATGSEGSLVVEVARNEPATSDLQCRGS
jgi:hypothetical protein